MLKTLGKLKLTDYTMIGIISFKIVFFYMLMDMKGLRFATAVVTILFILLIISTFGLSQKKGMTLYFGIIYSIVSGLMFVDSMYFSYFNQLPSILQLAQVDSMIILDKDTFKIALPLLNFVLLADIPLTIYYFSRVNKRIGIEEYASIKEQLRRITLVMSGVIIISVINPLNADALKIVNQSELVSYHLRDIFEHVLSTSNTYIETDEDAENFLEELNKRDNTVEKDLSALAGAYDNYNLIVIQVESLQNFVIGKTYNGVELTPNLNKFIKNDSLYFDHYYETIGRGNTSDAEFASNNSLYPVIDGESYKLYELNTYNGLPWLLKKKGYSSIAYHGFDGDFWNRKNAYVNQGFDDFFSLEKLDLTEKISFGLSDKAFFDQMFEKLQTNYEQDKNLPFHTFAITLSSHFPYEMPNEYSILKGTDELLNDSLFLNYLQSIHYADMVLGRFLEDIKNSEFGKHTVVVVYGDHFALNAKESSNFSYMSVFLGKTYDYDEMLNIPLIIHLPGLGNKPVVQKQLDKVCGQVDLLPTLAYLMNFNVDDIAFGQNILSNEPGFVASLTYMLKGSFIKDGVIYEASPTEVFEEGRAWSLATHEPIEELDNLYDDFIKANKVIESSKYILDNNWIIRE